ncbi:two-component system response regulator [Candidatus Parcubacteria bacterium]|nr:MAG: two-component system response regulator [Candidatus Parcubacteria bacterium]
MSNKDAHILLVDDSAFMRNVLKNILEKEGYKNVDEAGNGKEALEKIKAKKPDLMLLDVIMPEMGGIDVIKKLGKEHKIIVVSAVGQDKVVEEAKEHGAVGYIIKPFDNNQVVEEVKKILA